MARLTQGCITSALPGPVSGSPLFSGAPVIRFRLGRHSEVMSFAHGRAISREAQVRTALSDFDGHAEPGGLAGVEDPARLEDQTGLEDQAADVEGYLHSQEHDRLHSATAQSADRQSGIGAAGGTWGAAPDTEAPSGVGPSRLRSAVPPCYSPTDSGTIPVGAVDWSAEAIQARVRQLVTEHIDFVWRSLRALGVAPADCDDGCQKVWCVVARKVASIEPGKERSFVFSVVMRVASDMRRSAQAQRSASLGDALPLDNDLISAEPSAEEHCDRQRARAMLEQMLGNLPWEQRVVFVMFEVEELGLQEIAEALSVPRGTVASRLRLAREAFNRALVRHQERARHTPQRAVPLGVRPRPPLPSHDRQIVPSSTRGNASGWNRGGAQ
jgi:RNA polymerase sigma-70 factor, ECF subfamily